MDIRDLRYLAKQYTTETTDIGRRETAMEFAGVIEAAVECRQYAFDLPRPQRKGPWAWALIALKSGAPKSAWASIASEAYHDSLAEITRARSR